MPLDGGIRAGEIAARMRGFSGAEIEHVVNEAGLLAVKESIAGGSAGDHVVVRLRHVLAAITSVTPAPTC